MYHYFYRQLKICLIENELLNHGVFEHIVKQIIKFLVAYKSSDTKIKLKKLFLDIIRKDKVKYLDLFNKYDPGIEEIDIPEKVEDIINDNPELYIFIDKINDDLEEFCLILKDSVDIKAIEVSKYRTGDKIDYFFNDDEYSFSRGVSGIIKEKKASDKYWSIFEELVEKFKEKKPGRTKRGSSRDAWLALPVGTTGLHTEWIFIGKEPEKKLEIGIHFENRNSEINHSVFAFFAKKENELKEIISEEFIFDKYWLHEGDWSRIYFCKNIETLDNFMTNKELKNWAFDNMVKIYDFYMKYQEDVKKIVNEIKS